MSLPTAIQNDSVIVNSRTGQRMRFETTSPDVLRIDCWSAPSSAREPTHTHPGQESRFDLLEGELVFEVDRTTSTIAAPGTITIPAGVHHRFWNASQHEAHYVRNEGRLDAFEPEGPLAVG